MMSNGRTSSLQYRGQALLQALEKVIYLTTLLCTTLILSNRNLEAVAQQIRPYLLKHKDVIIMSN